MTSKIIYLHNRKNGFLTAHNDHVDLRSEPTDHSLWTLDQRKDYALLKAYNGYYLSSNPNGIVRLHKEADNICHFQIREHDQENKISIIDSNQKFITTNEHGHLKSMNAHDDQPTVNMWFHVETPHSVHNRPRHVHHAEN